MALWNIHRWRVSPSRLLMKYGNTHDIRFILQIGSNDGKNDDPVHSLIRSKVNCSALLVEPVPFLFERLKQNYSDLHERIQFANFAIASGGEEESFYYVDQAAKKHIPELPDWYDQLGSFNKLHILKHFKLLPDEFIVEVKIPTLSLQNLLVKYSIEKIDLLHIDTEGHDWSILSQLDLDRYRPSIILFEWKHLSSEERQEAIAVLGTLYEMTLLDVTGDMLCVNRR